MKIGEEKMMKMNKVVVDWGVVYFTLLLENSLN